MKNLKVSPLSETVEPLKFRLEYRIATDISHLSKDEKFETVETLKGTSFYTVYWDVSLSIKHNEMIWSVILRPKAGPKIVTTHTPLFLDAVENKIKILGSLVSRWAKPSVKPT
jgi:hypothetical protein